MRRFYKILSTLLILIILSTTFTPISYSEKNSKSLTILFTHDMHDHFYPFNVEKNEDIISIGGYTRLYSAIEKEREKDPNLLLIDAGDFSMGTLFQTIFSSDSPSLRMLGQMDYDVVTLGNHEFDFRAEGLAYSLNMARRSQDKLPQIVSSNITFPLGENDNLTPSLELLKNAMDRYGVKDYTILERNDVKIGIFGVLGKDADSNAPMSEVEFTDAIDKSKEMVNILKNKEKVDLIVCLSHSGTWDNKSKSEDEILAKQVPEIDVIISGHTHTEHHDPIIIGNTILCSSGNNGEYLGVLDIFQNKEKRWDINKYKLKPIDDSLPENPSIANKIEYFKSIVQEKYLDNFNMDFDQVLAYTPFNFTPASLLGEEHKEDILGNLIGDSYIYAVKKAEGIDYEPITAAEVDASIQPIMDVAQLYISGMKYTFNPNRLIFNKVTDVQIENPDGTIEEIDDNKLYRVIVGLYSAQMLSVVGDKSFGLLSIIPKNKYGTPITDFEAHIIYDNDRELKEWFALAEYLNSFEEKDGIPQVPEYYSNTHERKIIDNNPNLLARLKNPNTIALVIHIVVLILMVSIISLIKLIIKKRKRKKYMFSR